MALLLCYLMVECMYTYNRSLMQGVGVLDNCDL